MVKQKTYRNYGEIIKDYGNDIFIIEYPFRWGGQFQDKKFWCAIDMKTGDAYDYHTKEHLKKDLSDNKHKWIVVRWHIKPSRVSIMEKSKLLNTPSETKG